MTRPVISLQHLSKTYGSGDALVTALDDVSLDVHRGDYLAIMGASGSGKSTMMNLIGCLDAPTRGRYLLDGIDTARLAQSQLSKIRNRKIGFVFQSFNLLPRTRAIDNVCLPLTYAGVRPSERKQRALGALQLVGLSGTGRPSSERAVGGQQQRVAIARAVITEPVLLLADEPTGALDSRSSAEVMALFDELNARGRTVVVITHEHEVAEHAKRIVHMRDGRIIGDTRTAGLPRPKSSTASGGPGGFDGNPT